MIYVLPGMGADHSMYPAPWNALPDCCLLDWPTYTGENSIADIAEKVARESGIRDGDTLIGSSLGGIVASEIAMHRQLARLFLVGSAKKKEEINRLLSVLHPLADFAPIEFMQLASGQIPHELAAMFSRGQADFMRAMCRAIFDWEGLDEKRIAPVRLHGRRDLVIPLPPDVDKILDGGHLIAMSHAVDCVNFIRSRL